MISKLIQNLISKLICKSTTLLQVWKQAARAASAKSIQIMHDDFIVGFGYFKGVYMMPVKAGANPF